MESLHDVHQLTAWQKWKQGLNYSSSRPDREIEEITRWTGDFVF
jgi:hypothetical protein